MSFVDRIRSLFSGERITPLRVEPIQTNTEMPSADDLPRGSEAEHILAEIVEQAIAAGTGYQIRLAGSERFQQLKKEPVTRQLAVIEVAALRSTLVKIQSIEGRSWQRKEAQKAIISQLLRRKIDVPARLQASLLDIWLNSGYSLEYSRIPGLSVLGAIERHAAEHGLADELRANLERINKKLTQEQRGHLTKWEHGVINRVAALLDPEAAANRPNLPSGDFAKAFMVWLEEQPQDQREGWQAMAVHAFTAGDKSVPTKKWQSEAATRLEELGKPVFISGLLRWLSVTRPDPTSPDHSLDILKGMLWTAPLVGSEDVAGAVGRFAEVCFRKVRGVGARSVKLGNSALFALSEMAEAKKAGAELIRLRATIKYPSARKLLDKRIDELADASGTDVAALEDASLPDHGIGANGEMRVEFGQAHVTLAITPTGTEIAWFNASGKCVKNPPAQVKAEFKEELAAFKTAAKDIEKARAVQAKRLEDSWLEQRSWSLADWHEHYCEHNLRRVLVEALLWRVEAPDGTAVTVIPFGGELHDVAGNPKQLPDDARVTLWHPLQAEPHQVLAWRQRILDLGLTQPIKQAYREVYVLTDAERQTGIYSNRFAAHILRQHQFRALCQARDWKYDFMGGWDSWNVPTRTLPALGLAVEYSVEAIHDGEVSEAYVPLHIATDQVRFINTADGQQLALTDIDPVVFSELMRDVDLFVAVTSVANDPAWTDGGPDGRFGAYWREWAFGDLGQGAEARKELIAAIAPKLSIADRLEIGEKALIVSGKRHKYAIHFGSTNIQIMPENRYLCIVPARHPAEADKIRLPFAGDNQLSTILAKAFMLVDENKITDKTILSQL